MKLRFNFKRAWSLEWIAATLAFVVIAGCGVAVHGWFLKYSPASIGFDEGHTVGFAERLIHHHFLPYVDAACHRGPLMYWYAAVFQAIWGPYNWTGMRLATLVISVLGIASCFAVGAVNRRPLAGAAAGAVYAYYTLYAVDIGAGISLGGEHVSVPPMLASVALLSVAVNRARSERGRLQAAFWAGFLACLAMLAKQTAAVLVAPLGLWALAWAFADVTPPARVALGRIGALAIGWLVPALSIIVLYAAHHELSTFFYWFYTFNVDVYMGPYKGQSRLDAIDGWVTQQPLLVLAVFLTLAGSLLRPLFELEAPSGRALLRAYNRAGFEATVGVAGCLTMVSALSTMRFWPHYFIVAVPWIGLAAGLHLERAVAACPPFGRKLGYVAASLAIASIGLFAASHRLSGLARDKRAGSWAPARPDAVCDRIAQLSKSDEGMLVWGFDADLYVSCQRHSVTRYITSHFVAGIVPPFWSRPNPAWVARDARKIIAQEVRSERPPLVLEVPGSLGGFSLHRVPELAAIVDADYCTLDSVTGRAGRLVKFYLRKDRPECKGRR